MLTCSDAHRLVATFVSVAVACAADANSQPPGSLVAHTPARLNRLLLALSPARSVCPIHRAWRGEAWRDDARQESGAGSISIHMFARSDSRPARNIHVYNNIPQRRRQVTLQIRIDSARNTTWNAFLSMKHDAGRATASSCSEQCRKSGRNNTVICNRNRATAIRTLHSHMKPNARPVVPLLYSAYRWCCPRVWVFEWEICAMTIGGRKFCTSPLNQLGGKKGRKPAPPKQQLFSLSLRLASN